MTHGTGDSYETPDALYNALDKIFNFKLDAFASVKNAKCESFYDEGLNALNQAWNTTGSIWMNPPFSRGLIDKCMEKAFIEIPRNGLDRNIVALVRDDPTTGWYDSYIDGKASEVWRLKKRLKFKGAKNFYNFPCCIVIYNYTEILKTRETLYKRWWYE